MSAASVSNTCRGNPVWGLGGFASERVRPAPVCDRCSIVCWRWRGPRVLLLLRLFLKPGLLQLYSRFDKRERSRSDGSQGRSRLWQLGLPPLPYQEGPFNNWNIKYNISCRLFLLLVQNNSINISETLFIILLLLLYLLKRIYTYMTSQVWRHVSIYPVWRHCS